MAVCLRAGALSWLARDLVIPVIDGLDEMPGHLHIRAIEQANAWGSDKPLMLTSRSDEYDKAVAAGRDVSWAGRVDILPLSIEASKAYILDATAGSPGRWEHLFRELKPGTPLKAALTVPLLLWLVRCIYGNARSDPGELADPGRFGDLAAIERHLIEQLVPAVYDRKTGLSRFGCTPAQAERWLSFLAARPGDADSHACGGGAFLCQRDHGVPSPSRPAERCCSASPGCCPPGRCASWAARGTEPMSAAFCLGACSAVT